MSTNTRTITLSLDLIQKAASHADRLGVSTEKWIEVALSERIRLEQETAAFFAPYIARASGRPLGEILNKAQDVPPMPGDELE